MWKEPKVIMLSQTNQKEKANYQMASSVFWLNRAYEAFQCSAGDGTQGPTHVRQDSTAE